MDSQMTADEASMIPESQLRPWVKFGAMEEEHEKEVSTQQLR